MTSSRPWTYVWRYPVPVEVYAHAPDRVRDRLTAAAVRDCTADGCTPHDHFVVEVVATQIPGWLEGRVTIPCDAPAQLVPVQPERAAVDTRVPIAPLTAELDRRGGVSLAFLAIDDMSARARLWRLYTDAAAAGHLTPRNARILADRLLHTSPEQVWGDQWPTADAGHAA